RCGGWRRGTTDGEQNFLPWFSGTPCTKLQDDGIVIRSSGVGWRRVVKLGFPALADGSRLISCIFPLSYPFRLAPVVELRISSSRDLVYWTCELLPRS
ncbi:unnamed protein product, partial [Brassica oleracea var. botrytis]